MPDREKVINAIECCVVNRTRCFDDNDKLCPYFSTKVYMCEIELLRDALDILKEQEAVEPLPQNSNGWVRTIKLWYCGACHSKISRRTSKYCPHCGRKVKWE